MTDMESCKRTTCEIKLLPEQQDFDDIVRCCHLIDKDVGSTGHWFGAALAKICRQWEGMWTEVAKQTQEIIIGPCGDCIYRQNSKSGTMAGNVCINRSSDFFGNWVLSTDLGCGKFEKKTPETEK